jgi:hypothetical protein
MASKAKGKHQLADLSTNSITGSPDNGRLNAVKKAQKLAQINILRIGENRVITATIMSMIPIKGMMKMACFIENPKVVRSGIHFGFIPIATIP